MNEPLTSIEMMFKAIETYSCISFELFKLKTLSLAADIFSSLASMIIIGLIVLIFLMMMNIGLAIWLGNITGSTFEGFFIVGSFYGLLAVISFIFRNKWIKSFFQQSFISSIQQPNS